MHQTFSAASLCRRQPLIAFSTRFLRTTLSSQKNDLDEHTSATLERIKQELEADKKSLKWRTPIGDRPGDWNSKFKLFANAEQDSDFIVAMQRPFDISVSGFKKWLARRKERIERFLQQYVPERVEILGPDLAAAHFLLYRGGAVKFMNSSNWMRANKDLEFNLPNRFDERYKVGALRCDNMVLYYEGLENLRCLQQLKFLSFHNVGTFDDWCLDRVSGSQYTSLEVLDVSGTKCTANGLTCLYRIPTLKVLIVDDGEHSLQYQLTVAMLNEVIPDLKVVKASSVHDTSE